MMKWEKLGIIFKSDNNLVLGKTHASIPTPIQLDKNIIRIFFNSQDAQGISRPYFIDVSSNNPFDILYVSKKPLLDLGEPGSFDDNGIMATSIVKITENKWYMYYVGFELFQKLRYKLFTGLAISNDGGFNFSKYSNTPILDRSSGESHFRCGPYCIKTDETFKLWYVGGEKWQDINGKSMPVYEIRYIESLDGIRWPQKGHIIIPIKNPDEHGFGRPYVIQNKNGLYQMFYSIRRKSFHAYRLGYAESVDCINWRRHDKQLNLDVTYKSFDSEAIMYAAPFCINEKLYIFYNGNNFGLDGIGLAVLEEIT
jgi:sucrose-6-phosphate hydrolase SacC (GH32 family)